MMERRCLNTSPSEAVQVDPIKPTLKAPEIKRLKLKSEIVLSNSAFKMILRRYHQGGTLG
jgi:hypothetical protein